MRKLLAVLLVSAMMLGAVGALAEVVLEYPTFQVGVNTAAPVIAQLVEEFNAANAGKVKIAVEEIPGDSNYIEKVKILLSSGDLPPVIYGAGYNLLDLALANDSLVDLTPYVEADPEWKGLYNDKALEVNSRDGKLYGSSSEGNTIGYFYNKELFAKAGIQAPAKTWDEFFAQLETLKAAGITPLSMDTADSAWVTSLWMGALIASDGEAGKAFMAQMMPDNYNTPEVIKALTSIQMMFQKYTTLDAVGGKYENAANAFLSGQTAIIANGPWMIGDFSDTTKAPEGFSQKVGVAIYPGGFAYDEPIQGYLVTKQADPEVEKAAVEMVKFFTSAHAQTIALEKQGMLPASTKVEISQAAKDNFPLLAEFVAALEGANIRTATTQATMYPNLLDVMSAELPNLASGAATPEQFAQTLTDAAAKNK
ncbi:MAG: ABC transporter substrate-binding protein [Christensenellales bacterium]